MTDAKDTETAEATTEATEANEESAEADAALADDDLDGVAGGIAGAFAKKPVVGSGPAPAPSG